MRRIACRRQFSIAGTPVLSSADYLLWIAIFQEAKADIRGCEVSFIDRKWWNYQSKMNLHEKNCLISIVSHDAAIIIIAWTWTGRGVASLFGLFCQIIIPWKWKGYFKTILFIGFNLNTHASTIAAYLARKLAFLSLNLVFLARRKANRALAASRLSSRSLW